MIYSLLSLASFQDWSLVIMSDMLRSLKSTIGPRLNPLRLGVLSFKLPALFPDSLDCTLDYVFECITSALGLARELCLDLP